MCLRKTLASIPEHAALADFAVMRPRRLGFAALLAVSALPALQQQLCQVRHCLSWLRDSPSAVHEVRDPRDFAQ